jgi:CheY-like chemotaxis protein
MVRFDGYEVARQLRSWGGFANSLSITVTGYGQPQDKNRATQAALIVLLVKPVDRNKLAFRIAMWAVSRAK